jgi:two-component system sensor histidine kinase/response regulator
MDAEKKQKLLEAVKQRDGRIEELSSQLEARSNLIRMIVHDLKGPLGSIMANLDLLLSRKLLEKEREILETALQGGSNLLNMINTLLEIGRMERGVLELNLSVIKPEEMLKAIVSNMKSLSSEKNIALVTDCRSRISSLAVDAGLLERLLMNLVMNAIKYTRAGGTITLKTEDGGGDDEVRIAVSDTGIGIPEEFHETIFDLYAQCRIPGERRQDRRGGEGSKPHAGAGGPGRDRRRMSNVGIGLAFCKLAAEQHGGRIWVESEAGKGSTFIVSLPTNLVPSGSGLV